MSTTFSIDRSDSKCAFTFTDSRNCRTTRTASHQHFLHLPRLERIPSPRRAKTRQRHLLSTSPAKPPTTSPPPSAVAQGHVKLKTANTLAYLGQTLVQSIQLAKLEFIEAFGVRDWHAEIAGHLYPPPPPKPEPPPDSEPDPAPASDCRTASRTRRRPETGSNLRTPNLHSTSPRHGAAIQLRSGLDSVPANQTR